MSEITDMKFEIEQIDPIRPEFILDFREIVAGLPSGAVAKWTPEPHQFCMGFGAYVLEDNQRADRPSGMGLLVGGNDSLAKICSIAVARDLPHKKELGALIVSNIVSEAFDLEIERIELVNDDHQNWLRQAAKEEGFVYDGKVWVYKD